MKTGSKMLSEMLKGNERGCLSTYRALEECYRCEKYESCTDAIPNQEYDAVMERSNRLQEAWLESMEALRNVGKEIL